MTDCGERPLVIDDRDEYVAELIKEVLPQDTAYAVLSCESFGKLAAALAWAGRDDANVMEGLLREAVVQLEPSTLQWLAEGAEHPAAFLISKVRLARQDQSY